MIRSAVLAALATVTINVAVVGSHAHADQRTCIIDPVSGLLQCTLVASPAPPVKVRLSVNIPLEWVRLPLDVGELIARGVGCVRTVAGVTEVGVGYAVALNNVVTGEQLYLRYVCTWPGAPPPSPPPPPPTPAELAYANTQALTLAPALSPTSSIGGLTGLDSWLWCGDPGPVSTGVALRGWTAIGEVHVVQVGWEVDGPGGFSKTSTSCGSWEAPSATWTPQTKGSYSVLLTAVWAGSWDLAWNGIPMGTFPLGPVSLSSSAQPYPVDEYRGELTG